MATNLAILINKNVAPVIVQFCHQIIRHHPNIMLLSAQKSIAYNSGPIIVPNISNIHQLIYFSKNGFYIIRPYWNEPIHNYTSFNLINRDIVLFSSNKQKASQELLTAVKFIAKERKDDRLPFYYSS